MPPWSWTGTKKIPISSIFKLENSMPGLYNTNFCNIGPPIWLLVLRCCRLGNGGGGGHRHRQNPFAGRHHKLQLVNAWALLYIFTNFYIKCMGCIIFTMRAPSKTCPSQRLNSQHFSPDLWCNICSTIVILGDYCAPARGTMEIMHPEGHIMPSEGGIMQPEGGIMFPEGMHSFHWPEGRAQ